MQQKFTHLTVLSVCLTLLLTQMTAQTILVSPTGDGGFENGATFAANGWQVANNNYSGTPQPNQWYVGSVGKNTGTNGVYISNDLGATNNYTITSKSITHFYRDVVIPAGQDVLMVSYDFKGIGETNYDYLLLTVDTSSGVKFVPTGSYQNPGSIIGRIASDAPNFAHISTGISVKPNSTVRVVFSWFNDAATGISPAASIDNISISTRTALNCTSITSGEWSNATTWANGNVPTNADNVVIANGHTVTIDGFVGCKDLTVGQGTSGRLNFAPSFGILNVDGHLTVATGASLLAFAGSQGRDITLLGNLVNNGVVNIESSTLTLSGTTPQTISGTGFYSLCNNVRRLTLNNPSGVTLTMPLTVSQSLALQKGVFNNGNYLTADNTVICGTTPSAQVTVTRSQVASMTTPITVAANAVYNVNYAPITLATPVNAQITEGGEIPANRTINAVTISNPQGVTLTDGLILTGATAALSFPAGGGTLTLPTDKTILCTNISYSGTLGTATGFVKGGSVSLTVGTLKRSFAFPVSSNKVNRSLSLIDFATTSGTAVVKVSVFNAASGTAGAGLADLSAARRWLVTKTGANLVTTTGFVSLLYGEDDGIGLVLANKKMAQSATETGVYNNIGGSEMTSNSITTALSSNRISETLTFDLAMLNAGTSYFALASTSGVATIWDGGAATSNWGDANNWSKNAVPTCANDVVIPQNVSVNLSGGNADYQAKSVYVALDATLAISDAAKTLTVGSCGKTAGDNQKLNVDGTLNIANGTIKVNGKVAIATSSTMPAQFIMSGGALIIDGNDGTLAGSAVGDLLNFGTNEGFLSSSFLPTTNPNMSINATGGTITIVDPPYRNPVPINSSTSLFYNSIVVNANINNKNPLNFIGNTIQLGDGVSRQVGSSMSGFTLANFKTTFGHVVVNGGNHPQRFVGTVAAGGNLTINPNSELNGSATVVGNIVNNGTATLTGVLKIGGDNITTSPTISGSGIWRNRESFATPSASIQDMNVDINGTLTLNIPLSISSSLLLKNGTINTTAGTLSLGDGIPPFTSLKTQGRVIQENGRIVGPFTRVIPNQTFFTTNEYTLFPVGDNTYYRPISLIRTADAMEASLVTAEFVPTTPTTTGLPLNAYGGINATTLSPTGYWKMTSPTAASGAFTVAVSASKFKKSTGNDTLSDFTNLRLVKRATGGSWTAMGNGTAAVPTSLSSIALTDLTTFGEFAIAGTDAAIPVELVFFKGNTEGSKNRLTWATATERNAALFIVERSNNGLSNWTNIAEQKAQGTSTALRKYTATDDNPFGISYYRLKMVDMDGKTTFSNSVTLVHTTGKFGIAALYPVPTDKTATLEFEATQAQNIRLTISDIAGRLVSQQNIVAQKGLNTTTINAAEMPQGVYILSLNDGRQQVITRFVKQ